MEVWISYYIGFQLTGGDTYTGRFLNENPIEFKPEFKIFINTNHLPNASDPTIFTSGRVKLIPFDRHFKPEEQDSGLKSLFREPGNMSGILNWLIEGYRLLAAEGLTIPGRVAAAIAEYQKYGDILGIFFAESLEPAEGNRLKTSILYKSCYTPWVKDNGYKALCSQEFVAELRKRFDFGNNGRVGNFIVGFDIKK